MDKMLCLGLRRIVLRSFCNNNILIYTITIIPYTISIYCDRTWYGHMPISFVFILTILQTITQAFREGFKKKSSLQHSYCIRKKIILPIGRWIFNQYFYPSMVGRSLKWAGPCNNLPNWHDCDRHTIEHNRKSSQQCLHFPKWNSGPDYYSFFYLGIEYSVLFVVSAPTTRVLVL